ncbi:hypothetical protein Tco_0662836 [Tanacetum coccineum]
MSTSKTYQQSLADAGSENRPPMLERGSYIPWASRFKRFLNSRWKPLPEWLKYVTQVRLAKQLTVNSFDDLFDYLSQFEKLVNASRAKKLEKSHDPLALFSNTRDSSSRKHLFYYVTHPHPTSYVQEEFVEGNECYKLGNCNVSKDFSNVRLHAILQNGSLAITGGGKGHYARNCPKPRVRDSKYSDETQEDAFKVNRKRRKKMNDPIAVANKQNCWTIDYKQLNALYNDFVPKKESFVEQTCSSSSYIPFVKILETKTMPSELPLINELFNIKVGFEKLFLLIKQNSKRASMFYTSKEEIALNDFCRDQVKPLLNELLDYFDGFQNLFQRDIKEMKDAFEQNDVYLDEIERQNDLLKDQLLEASLKHDIELCVLLNHECVDKSLHDELEQVKNKSLEIQEGLKARIKILEKDVQRCEKQSVNFELKLQHEKEKHKWDSSKNKNSKPLDFSWISRIQKLEDENMSLDFKVQSLIK